MLLYVLASALTMVEPAEGSAARLDATPTIERGVSIHAAELNAHRGTPPNPALIDGPVSVGQAAADNRPCRTVFGFLPYWVSPSSVRWDQMTHVAAFNVEVNGTGVAIATNGWPWTSTINAARANGVKILITMTNFSDSQLAQLVGSSINRQNFYTTVVNQVRNDRADGVVLDFEGTNSTGWAASMPTVVSELRTRLNALSPPRDYQIFVATPAVNWTSGWNFAAVAAQADGLFIMGYDFYGSFSSTSGPSAPLAGGSFNINNTVLTQYAAARSQDPRKLILGVPYYGNQWRTTGSAAYSSASSWVGSVTFSGAASQVQTFGRQFDSASQTPWYRWQNAGQWNQTWFDDAASLGAKFDLAAAQGFAGVGMWALTYDGSRNELWDLLRQRFITGCPCPLDFNADGFLNQEDLSGFLTAFLAEPAPAGPSGFGQRCGTVAAPYVNGYQADYNRDCGLDQEDLGGFITEYLLQSETPGSRCKPG